MEFEVASLDGLKKLIEGCTRCPLSTGRTKIVFGMGNPTSKLMFVGEAPGRVEDERGLPFVGPAGKLLDELLAGIGLRREDVYITNVVKCRPPGNRDPNPGEIETCNPFLSEQIRLIEPRIVCSLGRVAAGVMLRKNVQISRIHGERFSGPGYFNVVAFHPAAALRTPETLELVKSDFQKLSSYLHDSELPPEPPRPEPEQMGLF
ncbi:MAG: uracil-DNA glycosylase [Actinomycetota bacterium]|nr:uracil-DNA glycosylase [Actinomycetota bacterium]